MAVNPYPMRVPRPPYAMPAQGPQGPMPGANPAMATMPQGQPMFTQGQGGPTGVPPQGMPMQPPPQGLQAPPGGFTGPPAPQQGAVSQDDISAYLGTQGFADEAADIARQRKIADAMRVDAGRQLQGVEAGNAYVAPSWLNVGANLAQRWRAGQKDTEAKSEESGMNKRKADVMAKWFRAKFGYAPDDGGVTPADYGG